VGEPSNQDQGAVHLFGGRKVNLGPEFVAGKETEKEL